MAFSTGAASEGDWSTRMVTTCSIRADSPGLWAEKTILREKVGWRVDAGILVKGFPRGLSAVRNFPGWGGGGGKNPLEAEFSQQGVHRAFWKSL